MNPNPPSPTSPTFPYQPSQTEAPPFPPHKHLPPRRSFQPRRDPALVFAPLAWLKLQLFLHAGDTEVGGFALSSQHDLLYVQDFVTLEQVTSSVTVEFTDDAVADYFDQCVDAGIPPARFARIWCHTHPGRSPDPSSVDEETFARVFGDCDWGVMFILSRTGRTYARLKFNAGPGGSTLLPVRVDWAAWPKVLLDEQNRLSEFFAAWIDEFDRNIHPYEQMASAASNTTAITADKLRPSRLPVDHWWNELDLLADERMLSEIDQTDLANLMAEQLEVSHHPFE